MAASHATWPQGITTVAVRQCKPTDCIQFHIIACSHDRHTDHRATAQTALLKKLIHVAGDLYYHVTNVHSGHKHSLSVAAHKQSRVTVRKTVYCRIHVTLSYPEDRGSFSLIFVSTKQNDATLSAYVIFPVFGNVTISHRVSGSRRFEESVVVILKRQVGHKSSIKVARCFEMYETTNPAMQSHS
jgi:hypothetical protein